MLSSWTRWWTRLNRIFSRDEWTVRLLRMPRIESKDAEPGLVMVQIDGLPREQLLKAIAENRMPLLKRLLTTESYRLHSFYPGLPSSTPSIQGELFYGVRSIVPAFSFRDPVEQRVIAMFEPGPAQRIEEQLASRGAPLLANGSAYANVFCGGAAASHYCATDIGWDTGLRIANPFRIALASLLNFPAFLRTLGLLTTELGLALGDFVGGSLRGGSLGREIKHIPMRVGVVILLRELCVLGASADITRGVPIIHLNLLGYDEQAHHRGPDSAVAHWTLTGIDRAIARLWHAIHRSTRRHYDLWVYSDHGQQATIPYSTVQGRTLQQAVHDLLDESVEAPASEPLFSRAHWIVQGWFSRMLFGVRATSAPSPSEGVQVAANGPLGFIYANRTVDDAWKTDLANRLVDEAACPIAIAATSDGHVRARTTTGWCELPTDVRSLFVDGHPFLDEVANDLVSIARHPLAGDLVVSGWKPGEQSISFATQSGAHAGPGPQETHAFALIPNDAPLNNCNPRYLRADDLRSAAMRLLDRTAKPIKRRIPEIPQDEPALRLLTYNVHGCVGMDGQLSPQRIARVIAKSGAEVVALQELDVGRQRSGGMDQAHKIAQELEMQWEFHPAWSVEEEQYGDAILSRLPMRLRRGAPLPLAQRRNAEPRGALWIEVQHNGLPVQIITTHLGLARDEQFRQLEALLGEEWLGEARKAGPVVLCGDFNCTPKSPQYRRLTNAMNDAQSALSGRLFEPTFSSWTPVVTIDHVFTSQSARIARLQVIRSRLARLASDHLPLLAEVIFEPIRSTKRTIDYTSQKCG